MNKKINTVLFIIAGTILNLVILMICIALISAVFMVIYRETEITVPLSWLAVIVIMIGSVVLSFMLYSRIIRWAVRKWGLDYFIEPVFRSKRKR